MQTSNNLHFKNAYLKIYSGGRPFSKRKESAKVYRRSARSCSISFTFLALLFFISPCILAQNSIVTENQKPGSPASEWDVSGNGDLSIQGFATEMSVNRGETISFKVNTNASAYTINIYRIGYYQGKGARKAGTATITASLPQQQPLPLAETATGLTDCGNWAESARWTVPNDAVSGVYIARLNRTDNGGASHIIFVVRNDLSNSDLYFKTSDATWQAYNAYGGNSFYQGNTMYPNGRAPKISYNRPFQMRAVENMLSYFFSAEYAMVRWLERNGYDVTYTTDVDADRRGNLISNHDVFLSVGHDEYWSKRQRSYVEAARSNGVNLAFFSGNEIYWKTRWEQSIDASRTSYRTLVCYKEGTEGDFACGGKCDTLTNVWTGLWRSGCEFPTADGCDPENMLSGQLSWREVNEAIQVPGTYKGLRFWRNTSIASMSTSETATLSKNTLGYEIDPEQPNYTYPAGRVRMSKTIIADITHYLSLYRHNNNALVFGAGTVQWAFGLDNVHDRAFELGTTQDARIQQATVNILADMNAQPGSLQKDLVAAKASTDKKAPSSNITTPKNSVTIPRGAPFTISGTAKEETGVVAGVEISLDGGKTWQEADGTTNWNYTWTPSANGTYPIKVRAFDDMANLEKSNTAANSVIITVNSSLSLANIAGNISEANSSLGLVAEAGEVDQNQDLLKTISINSLPNPSHNYFNLIINSNNFSDKISLRIINQYGKTVEQRIVNAGQVVQVGSSYHAGIYFVEVIQSGKRATLKLVRL